MKVKRKVTKYQPRVFKGLDDISAIARKFRLLKTVPSSKAVAEYLAKVYSNLVVRKVKVLMHDGVAETYQWVNMTTDGKYIIDVTGDRFSYFTGSRYRHAAVPWLYKASDNNMYFSSSHIPIDRPATLSKYTPDTEVLLYTRNPLCQGVRCILL